ncbi:MAG: hypothetical protein GQ581_00600, partial [Methyloprofundus sp.]|nr:hypothetical protein [Methyloprofundus sp.]
MQLKFLFILLVLISLSYITQQEKFQRLNDKGVISTVSVLEDSGREWVLADVLAMQDSFKRSEHVFSGGYSQSAYWFRVVVQRGEGVATDWILSAKPTTADDLSFYTLNDDGEYEIEQLGSLFISPDREVDKLLGAYSFKLNLKDTTPQVFYLRLQSRSAILLQLLVNSAAEISQKNINRKLALGILFGALLMVAINILLMWRQVNYKFYIAFVGYIVASVINIMVMEGGFIECLWPKYPQMSLIVQDISFCSFVIFKAIFFIYFFDTKKQHPTIHRLFLVFIGIVFLTILVSPFDIFTLIAPTVIMLMIIAATIQLYIAWFSGCKNVADGCYIFIGFALYFIVFIVTLLVAAGVFWIDPVGILATRIILFVLFIFIGLHKNFQKEQKKGKQAKIRAEKLIFSETIRSKERSNFLNLVAHEIKTPLTVIDSAMQVIQANSNSNSEMVQERYGRVRASVKQLDNLLENLLTAERDEKLPFHAELKPIL